MEERNVLEDCVQPKKHRIEQLSRHVHHKEYIDHKHFGNVSA